MEYWTTTANSNPWKDSYERKLKERQRSHLEHIGAMRDADWQPCMHDQCDRCHGTGVSIHGACVHMISCPCPRCSPRCM